MSTLNCKMCAAPLKYVEGKKVIECEYCGSYNTLPNLGDEKRIKLFDRANKLRANCDFEKASGVYEAIVAEFPDEAEAYWGLVLCRYGIEYVDDPATGHKVPTCHRSSYDSVFKDPDFELVMENSNSETLDIYRAEAKQIEDIRKRIVEISIQEDPYDVFICYKETDENGNRTAESVFAQDVYDSLCAKGYKVFFSRITLEDKLGQQYEPYIFAALTSAKVMLAFGFSYQNYYAVWVKNEWIRFLKLMQKDKSKYLIPCYKDIDAYDIPEEFSRFQAQDMGKVGAVQDLVHGVEKLLPSPNKTVSSGQGVNVNAKLSSMFVFLEDREWNRANAMADSILDLGDKSLFATAYLGKLMCELYISHESEFANCLNPLDKSQYYAKVIKYADEELMARLENYNQQIIDGRTRRSEEAKRLEAERKEQKRKKLLRSVIIGVSITALVVVVILTVTLFKKNKYNVGVYNQAMEYYNSGAYDRAASEFDKIPGYSDSKEKRAKIAEIYSFVDAYETGKSYTFDGSDIEWIVIRKDKLYMDLISKNIISCCTAADFVNGRYSLPDLNSFSDYSLEIVGFLTENQLKQNEYLKKATPSDEVIKQGLQVDSNGNCKWWIYDDLDVSIPRFVSSYGIVQYGKLDDELIGVRPMITVKVNTDKILNR